MSFGRLACAFFSLALAGLTTLFFGLLPLRQLFRQSAGTLQAGPSRAIVAGTLRARDHRACGRSPSPAGRGGGAGDGDGDGDGALEKKGERPVSLATSHAGR